MPLPLTTGGQHDPPHRSRCGRAGGQLMAYREHIRPIGVTQAMVVFDAGLCQRMTYIYIWGLCIHNSRFLGKRLGVLHRRVKRNINRCSVFQPAPSVHDIHRSFSRRYGETPPHELTLMCNVLCVAEGVIPDTNLL